MNRIMIRAGLIASALGLLTIGIGGGYWWAQRHADAHAEVSQPAVPAPQERQVLYWYDPMVPDQHFDQPGKSPFMDMQLVPRYAEQAATAGSCGAGTAGCDTSAWASACRCAHQ